jgi:hypothetical protein
MKSRYTSENVMLALEAIANSISEQKASLDYRVLRTTILSRIDSHTPHQEIQKLAPVQEKRLIEWILVHEGLGLSPTHTQIKDFAQRLLAVRGDTITLGKRWIRGLLKRNPILRTKK